MNLEKIKKSFPRIKKSPSLQDSVGAFFVKQFLSHPLSYTFAFLCLLGTQKIQSYVPLWTKQLIDSYGTKQVLGAFEGHVAFQWKCFSLALAVIVIRTFSRYFFFLPARYLQKNLKVELTTLIEKAHPSRYKTYSHGDLFQILQNDMENLRAFIGFALLQLGNFFLAMIILFPRVGDLPLSLRWALIPLFIMVGVFSLFMSQIQKGYRQASEKQGVTQQIFMESYEGKKTLQTYSAEQYFEHIFDKQSHDEMNTYFQTSLKQQLAFPCLMFGFSLSFLGACYLVYDQHLHVSDLVLFSGLLYLFQEPLMFFSWVWSVFSRARGSWNRLKTLEKQLIEKKEVEGTLKENDKVLVLEIPFYDHQLSLRFDLPLSGIKCFVGPTGVGKTWCLEKIADLLDHHGKKVRTVFQSPYLFNDTIEKNIFLGRTVDDQEKEKALRLLELFELTQLQSTKTSENLLSIEVGESGKRLSGGQQKRLALIRSLLGPGEILIWDDPFSSIDVMTEKMIWSKLEQEGFLDQK